MMFESLGLDCGGHVNSSQHSLLPVVHVRDLFKDVRVAESDVC